MSTQKLQTTPAQRISGWGRLVLNNLRALYGRPITALGTTIFLFFVFLAIFGPLLAPYSYNEQVYADARQPPSADHWFGTDNLGRDVFSRVLWGSRDVLAQAGIGTILAVISGTFFGLISGYRGGWFDEVFDALI